MNEATILIAFVLMLLARWVGYIVDVNGAFLHGHPLCLDKWYNNVK
jgi:hypothetical protein